VKTKNNTQNQDRLVAEQANAWIDAYKALLFRFEHLLRNWSALRFIAFSVIFSRKMNKETKV
jgi:hypothetical protein